MKDDLEQLFRSLHLKRIAELFDEECKRADKQKPSYQEFLARLLRAQWQRNQETALAWRIKQARLPEQWSLETFPFKKQKGVDQRQIRGFAELEFIPKAENIVFVGGTGVGKTGLASALLLKALQNGHRGVFMRAQDLFDEMYASLADRSTRKLLNCSRARLMSGSARVRCRARTRGCHRGGECGHRRRRVGVGASGPTSNCPGSVAVQ